jgi:hypothetical protein
MALKAEWCLDPDTIPLKWPWAVAFMAGSAHSSDNSQHHFLDLREHLKNTVLYNFYMKAFGKEFSFW